MGLEPTIIGITTRRLDLFSFIHSCPGKARTSKLHVQSVMTLPIRLQDIINFPNLYFFTTFGKLLLVWVARLELTLCPHPKCGGLPISQYPVKSGDGGNRTPDTRIFSPLLYQLSYITICTPPRIRTLIKRFGVVYAKPLHQRCV